MCVSAAELASQSKKVTNEQPRFVCSDVATTLVISSALGFLKTRILRRAERKSEALFPAHTEEHLQTHRLLDVVLNGFTGVIRSFAP